MTSTLFLQRDDLVDENATLCGSCFVAIEWNEARECWVHLCDSAPACEGAAQDTGYTATLR